MKITCPGCKSEYVVPDISDKDKITVVCDNCPQQFEVEKGKRFFFFPKLITTARRL